MNPETNPWVMWLWAALATLSGAASSLSFQPYKSMSWKEIALAFTVSSTFAIFVGSFVAEYIARWFGSGQLNIRAFGAVMWFMATSAHFLIPVTINRAKRFITAWNGTEPVK